MIMASIEVLFLALITKNSTEILATNKLTIGFKTPTPSIDSHLPFGNTEAPSSLKYMPYICYLIWFKKDWEIKIHNLIDSNNEVNTMTPVYAKKLGLHTRKINIST